ncbi:hypothetical protein BIW11_14218 [Tropilaelaps mercedesae]|uniref:Uncharacterized protein n=1 Tax=Tropilaelaps mercedesae TaxID=418985 RepID=A0A1V9WYL8_9ACAR|nr:hypothetical protein BIW11_14218 [Tropilaelaps mercedesae]
MLQHGSWCVVLTVAAAGSLMTGSARGQLIASDSPSESETLIDWSDAGDLQKLRDLRENGRAGYRERSLLDMKHAFHAMRGKKASRFHAMRGKKLKGGNGDINTIIAELRRQIMAGKRGSFFGMRGKRLGGPADLETAVATPIMDKTR